MMAVVICSLSSPQWEEDYDSKALPKEGQPSATQTCIQPQVQQQQQQLLLSSLLVFGSTPIIDY
jgi:hypothetical protein